MCVTPVGMIDRALLIASRPEVIFTSFGDMLRVPGSRRDLLSVKAGGGDVRIVYSPLDAVSIARRNPSKKVVFFAVGFETTAPANAMAVLEARRLGLTNFSILCSHVTVPPALELILSSDPCHIQGVLAAGHVCTVMGYEEYFPICERFAVPIVVTGFEPVDILQGIYLTVKQLEEGRAEVENQYSRVVRSEGNIAAREAITRVFRTADREWRGIGTIPMSGYTLRRDFELYDAEKIFPSNGVEAKGVAAVPRGIDPPGDRKAGRVPGVRQRMHPRNAPRRADGVIGRRLRGLLSLCEVNGDEQRTDDRHPGRDHGRRRVRLSAPHRGLSRRCCWPTAGAGN